MSFNIIDSKCHVNNDKSVTVIDVIEKFDSPPFDKNRIIIIVDYSNLLYRAYFSCMRDLDIKPWIPFVRALDMLRTCVKHCRNRYPDCSVEFIFAGDSVRRKLDRMKVDENYKADRPALTNLYFYTFRSLMKHVIEDIGCKIIYNEGSEGDDVIATVVAQKSQKCRCEKQCSVCECMKIPEIKHLVIFSMDKDLNSLLQYKNVVIYRPPSIFYTREMFENEYGFSPKYFTDYKALIGDRSDNIKPVPRWGDVRAKNHILKGDWKESLEKDNLIDHFHHNISLIDLNDNVSEEEYNGYFVKALRSKEVMDKIEKEYYKKEAADDVSFAEQRLEEACK